MKELSIEEKAKAYNGLIERLKDLKFAYRFSPLSDTIEDIFPELAESEDEKIRKEIINYFKCQSRDEPSRKDIHNKWIAWLEKQGENSVCKVKIGETYKCIASPRYTCFRMGDIYHVKDNFVAELINICSDCFVLLEEQGEQKSIKDICDTCDEKASCVNYCPMKLVEHKSADKVEPKFKVGDWVVYDKKIVCYIDRIYHGKASLMYTVTDTNNTCCSYSIKGFDMVSQLWTIQDAKDGDVLYDGNNACLFRKKMEDDDAIWVDTYCGINSDGMFNVNDEDECWCLACDCVPATKEQRDTLMNAMAEAGYTFDFEKKELKKIEQKSADESFAFKDKLLELFQRFRWYCKDEIPTNGDIIKYVDAHIQELIDTVQNKPWSEEDEKIFDRICDLIHSAAYSNCDVDEDGNECEEYANIKRWFSLLKDRVQPKQEWSEEDKEMFNTALDMIEWYSGENESKSRAVSDWLKSLKDRYAWKPSDLPHWKKSTLPNDDTTGFNSDYFCYKGYNINYKELFEKLPKDD